MSNVQYIYDVKGQPTHVVIPLEEFEARYRKTAAPAGRVTVPSEVAFKVAGGANPLKAWREYKGLSQDEVAAMLDKSRPAYAQNEKKGRKPQRDTIGAFAAALGLDVRQGPGTLRRRTSLWRRVRHAARGGPGVGTRRTRSSVNIELFTTVVLKPRRDGAP